ncbi:hypothetical protein QUF80_09500 [Desulfococcaceae bacterium HSG8]|nr:hypothetical protein [Desulfococcaceae bacterium HSG8]
MSIPREHLGETALPCSVRIDKSEPRGGGFVNPPRASRGNGPSCSVRIDKSEPPRRGICQSPASI